jgi:hypothetical protein
MPSQSRADRMNQRNTTTTSVVGTQLLENNPLENSIAPLVASIPVETLKSPFSRQGNAANLQRGLLEVGLDSYDTGRSEIELY